MKKSNQMKARGIRFDEKTWKNVTEKAKKWKCTPSDLVRASVDIYLDNQK